MSQLGSSDYDLVDHQRHSRNDDDAEATKQLGAHHIRQAFPTSSGQDAMRVGCAAYDGEDRLQLPMLKRAVPKITQIPVGKFLYFLAPSLRGGTGSTGSGS